MNFGNKDDQDEIMNQIGIFEQAQDFKLKAIYVDIIGDRVLVPDETIGLEKCKEMIDILNIHTQGFDIILNESDEHFKETVKFLDPQIYSGTIKSDFTKYKDTKTCTKYNQCNHIYSLHMDG